MLKPCHESFLNRERHVPNVACQAAAARVVEVSPIEN